MSWTVPEILQLYEGGSASLTFTVHGETDDEGNETNPPNITGYTISPEIAEPFFTPTYSGNVLNLHAPTLVGSFPIIRIRYRKDNQIFSVMEWDDVPEDQYQIVEYSKDPGSPKTLTISVSADDGSSVSWGCLLHGDYSIGVPRLLEEIRKRQPNIEIKDP